MWWRSWKAALSSRFLESSTNLASFPSTSALSHGSSSYCSRLVGEIPRPRVFCSSAPAAESPISSSASPFSSISRGQSTGTKFLLGARHYGRCYWELSKARLSLLVVATSGAGYVLGSGNLVDVAGLCWTCAGTMMVASSANSLNQIFEIKNDAMMKRTRNRPLPSARISVPHAITWATVVGTTGVSLLAWKTNLLASGLAASNLSLYAFIYTPLKVIHPINTWVGAVVGAIPPLLGWAAASGEISLNSMILPAALYFWQIPHFMALAYLFRNDYAAGGFRMFSLIDVSGWRTSLVSLRNCFYLFPLGYLAYDWGIASKWVFLESSLLTLGITTTALLFVFERNSSNARRMFHASLLYLPVFMSGLLLHRLPNENQKQLPITHDEFEEYNVVGDQLVHKGDKKNMSTEDSFEGRVRPPVAYASIAPFPFLPAPLYVPQDS